jgi:hypothetical protein
MKKNTEELSWNDGLKLPVHEQEVDNESRGQAFPSKNSEDLNDSHVFSP